MSNLAMMMGLGSAAGAVNVADVFSTTLYTGTSAEQTITNGIDLAGEGGLVWTKGRNNTNYHYLIDTERGAGKFLFSNDTSAQAENTASISSFNSDGYVLGNMNGLNGSPDTFVSWTWRQAPNYFDVVTWTGDDTDNRAIPHNLGTTVGCYFVKCISHSTASDWIVWHKDLSGNSYDLVLNTTAAEANYNLFSTTAPDSSNIYLGTSYKDYYNTSGRTYVAYIFAHNEGLIQCGSYTGNGSTTGPEIDLGWQPQWVMIKNTSSAADWYVLDAERGLNGDAIDDPYLRPNLSNVESSTNILKLTATGFQLNSAGLAGVNANGNNYIYIAIKAEG